MLAFVNSSRRTEGPHGGASYVQMSHRDRIGRGSPPLIYCWVARLRRTISTPRSAARKTRAHARRSHTTRSGEPAPPCSVLHLTLVCLTRAAPCSNLPLLLALPLPDVASLPRSVVSLAAAPQPCRPLPRSLEHTPRHLSSYVGPSRVYQRKRAAYARTLRGYSSQHAHPPPTRLPHPLSAMRLSQHFDILF